MPDKREQTISAALTWEDIIAEFNPIHWLDRYDASFDRDTPLYCMNGRDLMAKYAAEFHLAQSSHEQARISELEAKLAAYEAMIGEAVEIKFGTKAYCRVFGSKQWAKKIDYKFQKPYDSLLEAYVALKESNNDAKR